jgi:hypothetical protein
MKSPKFTDQHRYQKPYRSAADSRKAGYLAERFKEYAHAAPQTKGNTRVASEVSGPSAVAAPPYAAPQAKFSMQPESRDVPIRGEGPAVAAHYCICRGAFYFDPGEDGTRKCPVHQPDDHPIAECFRVTA